MAWVQWQGQELALRTMLWVWGWTWCSSYWEGQTSLPVAFWLGLALPSGGGKRWWWLQTREAVASPSLDILKKPSVHGPGQWPCLTRGLIDQKVPHTTGLPARGGAGHGNICPWVLLCVLQGRGRDHLFGPQDCAHHVLSWATRFSGSFRRMVWDLTFRGACAVLGERG